MANRKKKGWFDFVKSFFRLDARSRSEKKERRRKWAFERLQNRRLPPLVAPSQRPSLTDAEEVQNKSALNVAIATAAAAEAAVAAAQIAAEVFKLSASVQISQPTSQTKQEKDQCSVTVIQKDSSDNVTAEVPVKQQCESEIHHIEGIKIKAAIAIQAAFRGYLARKALRALKGIVKLQALIRGRAVRRQAITTLKRLQSIVNIHSQVCATRSNVVERTWNCSENCQMKLWRDKIKVEKINTRRWDDSLLSKDKEDALVLSKKEAALKRERIREYSFNHRKSAESENRRPNGRWRYWLEQWVDTQLNKSKEFEDLDPVIGTNPKSKEENGGRQPRPRSNLRPQQQPPPKQQHETSESPMSSARRQFRHKKQSSAGDDIFPSSPSVPTYMAATESAKAKARSLSSPKLRPGAFDAYSDSYSPYKNKLSLVSSIVSEVPTLGSTYRSVKPIGQQQRSPSLKGLPSAVKSTRVAKDLNFD